MGNAVAGRFKIKNGGVVYRYMLLFLDNVEVIRMQQKRQTAAQFLNGHELPLCDVVIGLDISGSMTELYRDGVVQQFLEDLLALSQFIDANKQIDMFVFGSDSYRATLLDEDNIEGYVYREIIRMFEVESSTKYAPLMKNIAIHFSLYQEEVIKKGFSKKYIGQVLQTTREVPILAFILTDGSNFDQRETTEVLTLLEHQPIYWQFIGTGEESFPYLQKVQHQFGNINFTYAKHLGEIAQTSLYESSIEGYKHWISSTQKISR